MVKTKKKMMKLPSLFKSDDKSSWPWPSCRQPRTLSFRITSDSNIIPSAAAASDCSGGDPLEAMIRGLRSAERLLFEPAGKSSSIVKEENDGVLGAAAASLEEGTTVISVESKDPYWDFRKSMEEMVEAHGLKEWENLEELLSWYLRVNIKGNHGFILGAFVDLLVSLALPSSSSSSSSSSSCSSLCYSSSSCSFLPCASSSMEIEKIPSLQQHHHHHHDVFS